MRMSEFARAIKFINSHRWREATTMKDIPHSYVVRANIPDKDEFNWFDDFIHREGEVGYFGKRMFKYLYLNGYKYFDCGDQRTVTDLVNRDQYPKSFRDSQTPYIPDIFGMQQQDEEEFELLVRSIIDDGCTIPIVVNKDTNVIVDGEHRWRACAVLGYHHVPVVYVDFTESQKRNATLRYNRARGKEDRRVAAEVEQAVEDTKIRK